MARYALINEKGQIVNVIEADPPRPDELLSAAALAEKDDPASLLECLLGLVRRTYVPMEDHRIVPDQTRQAELGGTWDGKSFARAVVEAVVVESSDKVP